MAYYLHIITHDMSFADQLIDECSAHIKDVTLNLPTNTVDVTLNNNVAAAIFELRALQLDVDIINITPNAYAIPIGTD